MILTSTDSIDGYRIVKYIYPVFGEVVTRVDWAQNMSTAFTSIGNLSPERRQLFEDTLIQARQRSLNELEARASNMGANAVVSIKVDYEIIIDSGYSFLVVTSGTAVVVEPK